MINETTERTEPTGLVSFPMKPLFENPLERTELVKFNMEHRFRIIGSCNGLLCLFDMDHGYVKLWNPSIGFELRNSPTLDCFDKRMRIRYYGFGYQHANDKYKVLLCLRLGSAPHFYEYVTQIYTFGKKFWTTIHNFPCESIRPVGKFVSGTLNWLFVKSGFSSSDRVILSFDLEKESYTELLLPENEGVKVRHHVLGVLSNCLCVCFASNKTHWNLWVMKNYGVAESWARLIVIPYEQLRNRVPYRLGFMKPVFILENGILLLSIINKFVLLNLNNGRLDECLLDNHFVGYQQHIYYESLVSPQL